MVLGETKIKQEVYWCSPEGISHETIPIRFPGSPWNPQVLMPVGHLCLPTRLLWATTRDCMELQSRQVSREPEGSSELCVGPHHDSPQVGCDELSEILWESELSESACLAVCRVQAYEYLAGNSGDKAAQFVQNQLILCSISTKWRTLRIGTVYSYK